MFKRAIYQMALSRLTEKRRYIQVFAGPRQVGKTTLALQLAKSSKLSVHYASADEPTLRDKTWIAQQWSLARLRAKQNKSQEALLILDEIQKIPGWSEVVKRLWDEDTRTHTSIKVILLGSAYLLVQRGLTESLAGRFEIIPVTHWSFPEMRKAFGFSLNEYIYFGGYPGAAELIKDEMRWSRYIKDSLIETTISRDILLMAPVNKPVLLRHLFQLGCHYSGQILSFQKMTGQLQDAGNTTTLAHYLELLQGAGMLAGIQKFAAQKIRQRGSSPKLQVLNTALLSAQSHLNFSQAQHDREFWGRLVESAVGAYLMNSAMGKDIEIFYWRERNQEVDFILRSGKKLAAIEVKGGCRKEVLNGMEAFSKMYKPNVSLLIGDHGLTLKEFFEMKIEDLFL